MTRTAATTKGSRTGGHESHFDPRLALQQPVEHVEHLAADDGPEPEHGPEARRRGLRVQRPGGGELGGGVDDARRRPPRRDPACGPEPGAGCGPCRASGPFPAPPPRCRGGVTVGWRRPRRATGTSPRRRGRGASSRGSRRFSCECASARAMPRGEGWRAARTGLA